MKNLYRGAFRTNRAICVKYAYAYTEKQAKLIMCRRMAQDQGVDPAIVMGHFKERGDNYEISIEVDFGTGEATEQKEAV